MSGLMRGLGQAVSFEGKSASSVIYLFICLFLICLFVYLSIYTNLSIFIDLSVSLEGERGG